MPYGFGNEVEQFLRNAIQNPDLWGLHKQKPTTIKKKVEQSLNESGPGASGVEGDEDYMNFAETIDAAMSGNNPAAFANDLYGTNSNDQSGSPFDAAEQEHTNDLGQTRNEENAFMLAGAKGQVLNLPEAKKYGRAIGERLLILYRIFGILGKMNARERGVKKPFLTREQVQREFENATRALYAQEGVRMHPRTLRKLYETHKKQIDKRQLRDMFNQLTWEVIDGVRDGSIRIDKTG